MEPLLAAPSHGSQEERSAMDEGDEIALAVKVGFEEVAQRLTDPLPLFKYLPHRYRRTAFARRVLRRVIEGAVGDRGVRLLFLIFGPAWPCLGLNGRGPLPPLDHASSSSPFTHTGTRRGGK